jgi:HAE1 family hydrophobic/amphiphilic exporter-1
MNVPQLCIQRPVMTTLLMAAFIIFGILGYRALPVSELPRIEFPTIRVEASLPGADPETMASSVATVLEGQFSTVSGIDSMTSQSATGSTRITLTFALNRDIDAAAQEVVAAIAAAQRRLPPSMPNPPIMRKVNPADFPVLYIAMSSPTLPLQTVNEYAETLLGQQISTISGVAQVLVYGSQKRAIRVQVNPDLLAARGIGIDEVQRAVQAANSSLPTGTISGPDKSLTVRATGQLVELSAYLDQIVAWRNNAPIRLREIGTVVESVENDKVAAWFNQDRAIILAIQRQPGINTIETVDAIKAILPSFRDQLPASIDLSILYDRSESIRESVHEVQFTLVLAACLVILVIFLFLRNLSATVIPSLALPISIIGTFGLMYAFGFSLDNLSLLALTLAVGYVVDDAIVMLENIVRHVEEGKSPMEAALVGSREIAFTILSITVSLIAVFIPIMFMGGIVGRLLSEFAITITAAIAVSGLVAVTLTPMMCSRFLRGHREVRHGWVYRAIERMFDAMLKGYDVSLRWCLRHKMIVMLAFAGTIYGTVELVRIIPKEFLPLEDTGRIIIQTVGAQDASFEAMMRNQQQAAEIIRRNPNVEALMSSVGAGGPRPTANSGSMLVRLKPREERTETAQQIIGQLRRSLAGVSGLNVFPRIPPSLQIGGSAGRSAYLLTLRSLDLELLYRWAATLEERLKREPGFVDVTSDLDIASPNVLVNIDRNKAATLGISPAQIESALAAAFGSQQISTIYTANNQYQVILEVEERFRNDPSALDKLYVRSSNGTLVQIGALATIRQSVGPLTISHLGQLPAASISFNLPQGVALGTAVARIRALERQLAMPASVSTSFEGTAQAFERSLEGMGILLLMAVLVVYIVLGVLYESFIHPLTILSGLPSAAVGALLALMVFNEPLSLYGFVGVIMLIGIVKKNAIMMIDFALARKRAGEADPERSIYDAALVRFRPIMMTTMAAFFGTLPIAIAAGGGSESRVPLGLAVCGGLALSQVVTLYLTPVLYVYMERLQNLRLRKPRATPPVHPAAAE